MNLDHRMLTRKLLLRTPGVRELALFWRLFGRPDKIIADTGRSDSYLREKGWLPSFVSGLAQDRDGKPIPWFTYPAIDFLTPRIKPGFRIFEYGCGQSSMWWERIGCSVVACESSKEWAEFVRNTVGQNVQVVFRDIDTGEYVSELKRYKSAFDIILIDGRKRNECAYNAPAALKDDGVIIWDNTERTRYCDALQFLERSGFRRLDFDGIGPVNPYGSRTTVLYRTSNCLGI